MTRRHRKRADGRSMTVRAVECRLLLLDTVRTLIQLRLQVSRMIVTRSARHDRYVGVGQRLEIAVSRYADVTCHAVLCVNKIPFFVLLGVVELQRVTLDDH